MTTNTDDDNIEIIGGEPHVMATEESDDMVAVESPESGIPCG